MPASLARENEFSTAALLLISILDQARLSGPIRPDWVFYQWGNLKRQELKKKGVSDRGGIQSCSTGQNEKNVFFEH